jgi:hypothetical protein
LKPATAACGKVKNTKLMMSIQIETATATKVAISSTRKVGRVTMAALGFLATLFICTPVNPTPCPDKTCQVANQAVGYDVVPSYLTEAHDEIKIEVATNEYYEDVNGVVVHIQFEEPLADGASVTATFAQGWFAGGPNPTVEISTDRKSVYIRKQLDSCAYESDEGPLCTVTVENDGQEIDTNSITNGNESIIQIIDIL